MLIRQTTALFIDAYRELNARRLFWVSLAISMLVVLVFAAVGINQTGFTIFWKQFPNDTINTRFIDRGTAYKALFENLGVNWWLTWAATGLALVSTASVFPDFLTGGSIDLYLSKPIGRARLFATKYLTGLLFVTLQVLVFCAASFAVIGIRGGVWEPAIFVAVPLVMLFFSYLYAVLIFFGVVTRSTIASLLLTIVFWAMTTAVAYTEHGLLLFSTSRQLAEQRADRQIQQARDRIASLTLLGAKTYETPTTQPMSAADRQLQVQQLTLVKMQQDRVEMTDPFAGWHRAVEIIALPFPKTTGTYELTQRVLGKRLRVRPPPTDDEIDDTNANTGAGERIRNRPMMREANIETDRIVQARSAWSVIGTSVLFELAVAAIAGALFCRRDF